MDYTRREFISFLPTFSMQAQHPTDICTPEYRNHWVKIVKKQSGRVKWYNETALAINKIICNIQYIYSHGLDPKRLDINSLWAAEDIVSDASKVKEYALKLRNTLK